MKKRSYKLVGSFELKSGELRVSDPCYKKNAWCNGVLHNMLPGKYEAYKAEYKSKTWGKRVKALLVKHCDEGNFSYDTSLADLVYLGRGGKVFYSNPWIHMDTMDIGVDSGQCGFFDDTEYQNPYSLLPQTDAVKQKIEELRNGNNAAEAELKQMLAEQMVGKEDFGDDWYSYCCTLTLSKNLAGVLPYGVVSSSGFGDGNYPVFVARNSDGVGVMACLLFI